MRESARAPTDLVRLTVGAHEEVVGLDVAMQERFAVHIFKPRQHLLAHHENRLEAKTAMAVIE